MRRRSYIKNRVGLLPVLDSPGINPLFISPATLKLDPIAQTTAPANLSPVATIPQTTDPALSPVNTSQSVTTPESIYVQGHILEDGSRAMLFGVTITLLNSQGNAAAPPVVMADNSNTFTVWTADPAGSSVMFQKPGYLPTLVAFSDLQYDPEVLMIKGSASPSYLWALLLLVPVLFMGKGKKKLGAINSGQVQTVLLIVGGIIGLSLLTKLLQKFGLWAGPGTQSVTQEQANPFSPWKPTFWKQYTSFTYAIDRETAESDASIIYNAFKLWTDDFNAIFGVFSTLRTQANISYLADVFNQKYDTDLLSFLTDGGGILPWDGLNETHLKTITDYVKNLPTH